MFVAPFVFGFTGLSTIAWSAWIAGILAVLLAGSVLLAERGDRSMLVGQR
jgi:energy-converting hydrogenase Eha subunit G